MCVVYATGEPRRFDFVKAERSQKVPQGVTVFASCDGDCVSEWLDDYTFDVMTDGEYYEMRSLVDEVRRCELIGRGCPYRGVRAT